MNKRNQFLLLSMLFAFDVMNASNKDKKSFRKPNSFTKKAPCLYQEIATKRAQQKKQVGNALICAAGNGDEVRVNTLIKYAKADVDHKRICIWNEDVMTPIVYAAWNNEFSVVKRLVESGADVNSCYDARKAIAGGHDDGGLFVNTLPILAIENQNFEMLEYVLEKGADSNKPTMHGEYPVHYLFYKDTMSDGMRMRSINLLRKYGCNLGQKSESTNVKGATIAHQACSMNRAGMIAFLMGKVSFKETTSNGELPLHYLAKRKSGGYGTSHKPISDCDDGLAVVNLLRNDIDKRCSDGSTPIMIAAEHGDSKLVESFKSAGARTDLTNNAGKTAFDIARANQHNMDGSSYGTIQSVLEPSSRK